MKLMYRFLLATLPIVFLSCGGQEEQTELDTSRGDDVALVDSVEKPEVTAPPAPILQTNDFLSKFNIPDSFAFSSIEPMIDEYLAADDAQRDALRASINDSLSAQLLAYGHLSSVWGVQLQSEQILLYGLAALSLENAHTNFKHNLTGLSLLHASSIYLKKNPELMFTQINAISSAEFAQIMDDFVARSDEEKDIRAFGYTYLIDEELSAFDYINQSFVISDSIQ